MTNENFLIATEKYLELHASPVIPTDLYIDLEQFDRAMEKYKYSFRRWGQRHLEHQRYGLPLVNLNGELYNNPEVVCYPLDQWNAELPDDQRVNDHTFTTPTEVLSHPAFDCLNDLKPYILRSCILKWMAGSFFYPHTDTKMPSKILRFWGTNDPENVKLRFDKDNTRCNPRDISGATYELADLDIEIEAGRLYLIDTSIIHDARSFADNTYQFFLAFDANSSYDTIAGHLV